MTERPTRLQVWSAPILLFINRMPKFVFPLFTFALLLGGLWLANGVIGGILLVFLGLILGWLLMLSWELLPASARGLRLLVVLMSFGYGIGRMMGLL